MWGKSHVSSDNKHNETICGPWGRLDSSYHLTPSISCSVTSSWPRNAFVCGSESLSCRNQLLKTEKLLHGLTRFLFSFTVSAGMPFDLNRENKAICSGMKTTSSCLPPAHLGLSSQPSVFQRGCVECFACQYSEFSCRAFTWEFEVGDVDGLCKIAKPWLPCWQHLLMKFFKMYKSPCSASYENRLCW